jgi:HAMP domain-containing protein
MGTSRVSGKETATRKFVIAFSAMFIIPMLLSAYLFLEYIDAVRREMTQLTLLSVCVALLGTGGFFLCRSVVQALLKATRDASAIAGGDLNRRLDTNVEGEISELAKNFNRITSRLQQTIDTLQASRNQMQTLVAQLCDTGSRPGDMTATFETFLSALLSLSGLEVGAISLMSSDGKSLKVRVLQGLDAALKTTVIPIGNGIVGWVASHGQAVVASEAMPWKGGELSDLERSMTWALYVPMASGGKTRGVISIGLRKGQKEISGDDLQMIRNLSSQMAVALETADLKRKEERAYIETVAALAAAVEARDKYTRGHSRRVTEFSVEIGERMGMPDWFVKDLESAALLHDLGKIGIPDHILHNKGPLPPGGLKFIIEHPIGGENILKPVGSLGRLCPIVRHHHERYDGEGYPDRLKGEGIPLASRILSVADSFDAMISDRAYKPTRTKLEAMKELARCKGKQFDPQCVDAFLSHLREHPEVGVIAPPEPVSFPECLPFPPAPSSEGTTSLQPTSSGNV